MKILFLNSKQTILGDSLPVLVNESVLRSGDWVRAFTIGMVYAKCKENLACEAQSSSAIGMLNM